MDEGKTYNPATERWVAGWSIGGTAGVWPQDEEVDDPICRVVGEEWAEERARLLAAAPDLLDAARRLLDVIAEPIEIVHEHGMDNAVQAMADAIRKATRGEGGVG